MMKFIENMRIDNDKFAEIIQEEQLVLQRDRLFEIAAPITTSILFRVNSGFSKMIMPTLDYPNKYFPGEDMHFVYNGELGEEIHRCIFDSIRFGAFTIGICTADPKEFEFCKEEYKNMKARIEGLGLGKPVRVISKEMGDHKAYILTYRK